jgi:hypothetical protein
MLKRIALALVLLVVAAALTLPVWKPAAKRFKWFVVATNVYQDTLRRAGLRDDQISQPDYGALPDSAVPAYLHRIDSTFADYQKYGGLTPDRLRGARVLEIGPGETLGVAIRFIGAGADQVTANDKFVPLQRGAFHQRLYRALLDELPPTEQANAADAVLLKAGVQINERRLSYIYGQGIEDVGRTVAPGSFDIIVSNAVLEEIYDADLMFDTLDRLLKPGGRQVHVIDLGDYGMLSKHGFHPLEFLTIPDAVYRYMVESTGQPNRRPLSYYRDKLASQGYTTTIYRTWVLGHPSRLPEYRTGLRYGTDYTDDTLQLVRSIKPRLLPRYRDLPDEELLTRSLLVVADKPVRAQDSVARGESSRDDPAMRRPD